MSNSSIKISVITVVYNRAATIGCCIDSVLSQQYPSIEYIVIDGKSNDGTLDIIKKYGSRIGIVISEPDLGIYDAINKGIKLSSGDVIGILNSDDFFAHGNVLESVAEKFTDLSLDAVFADVCFFQKDNLKKTIRKYSSRMFAPWLFRFGFMPAHPTFYVRRKYFYKLGSYKLNYKIAADYELLVRFLYCNKLTYQYIPEVLVHMRLGGVSTQGIKSFNLLNKEIRQACLENGLYTNYLMLAVRIPFKLCEFFGVSMRNMIAGKYFEKCNPDNSNIKNKRFIF